MVNKLFGRVDTIEEEISKALNTMSEGVANNFVQVWENQKELAKALDYMSNCAMEENEADNEKATGAGS